MNMYEIVNHVKNFAFFRVEWYFGDVTQTLMMIPKEYFASFDLVLVDLSETVMR